VYYATERCQKDQKNDFNAEGPLHLRQNRCRFDHGGLLGEWVKYNQTLFLFIYLYFFPGTQLQVRPVNGFSRLMAQTSRNRIAQECAFWGLVDIAPHFGGEFPNPHLFWGRK